MIEKSALGDFSRGDDLVDRRVGKPFGQHGGFRNLQNAVARRLPARHALAGRQSHRRIHSLPLPDFRTYVYHTNGTVC